MVELGQQRTDALQQNSVWGVVLIQIKMGWCQSMYVEPRFPELSQNLPTVESPRGHAEEAVKAHLEEHGKK